MYGKRNIGNKRCRVIVNRLELESAVISNYFDVFGRDNANILNIEALRY